MVKKEFERVMPESVGIPSEGILKLLDRLEGGGTEMHGLMIMRHDKICAEGWWKPYGAGIRHSLHSLSKTYSATAVGIACREGLLDLEEAVIHIFPEEAPGNPDEYLRQLKVRDVLSMGCGMETIPEATECWIKDFLAAKICRKPGTAFMYNSMGSTLLGAMVERRSGERLEDYLRTRLFDKIGIDSSNTMWEYMPDGTAYGGGGFYASTEDNLRLMKLYKDGGRWEGEEILSEEYVRLATSRQIDSSTESVNNPEASDNFLGYGFQIWMCAPEGVYRADGAMGQFSIVFPRHDMIISINETAGGAHWAQNTLDIIWDFLEEVQESPLPEDKVTAGRLKKRLGDLALDPPVHTDIISESVQNLVKGRRYQIIDGKAGFETETENLHGGIRPLESIREFSMVFEDHVCVMNFWQEGEHHRVSIPTDGTRCWNRLRLPGRAASEVYFSGTWESERCFLVQARWIETCYENIVRFYFEDDRIRIVRENSVGGYRAAGRTEAVAVCG